MARFMINNFGKFVDCKNTIMKYLILFLLMSALFFACNKKKNNDTSRCWTCIDYDYLYSIPDTIHPIQSDTATLLIQPCERNSQQIKAFEDSLNTNAIDTVSKIEVKRTVICH